MHRIRLSYEFNLYNASVVGLTGNLCHGWAQRFFDLALEDADLHLPRERDDLGPPVHVDELDRLRLHGARGVEEEARAHEAVGDVAVGHDRGQRLDAARAAADDGHVVALLRVAEAAQHPVVVAGVVAHARDGLGSRVDELRHAVEDTARRCLRTH